MRTKTILLHSVSAIATAAAAVGVAGQAQAQVLAPGDDGYTFSVQGGLLFSPAEQTLAGLDKMGSGIFGSGDSAIGYNAAFSVGKQIDENWDVRFGGSINKLLENTVGVRLSSGDSYYSSGLGGSFESGFYSSFFEIQGRADFAFEALDFEVGYTPTLQEDLSIRLFAGIRALHYSSTGATSFGAGFASGFSYSAGFGSGSAGHVSGFGVAAQLAFDTEFFGVGPRVGVSAAHRFAGTSWGLSGTVAGAALFGRQTYSVTNSFSSGFYSSYYNSGGTGGPVVSGSSFSGSANSTTSAGSTDKLVFDLQVKGGVDFYLDDKTALTFGYQAEQLFGVGMSEDSETNKLVHGPFISLSGAL